MAGDFSAPSFSLGIDDDAETLIAGELRKQTRLQMVPEPPSFDLLREETLDPEPPPPSPPANRLKRLRRGPARPPPPPPPPAPAPAAPTPPPEMVSPVVGDGGALGSWEEEIEEFSEEERHRRDVPPSVGSCSTSSSLKFSLRNNGLVTSQSTSKAKIPKITPTPKAFNSAALEESSTKKLLPKITISPLRKIHLLDSDTDSDGDRDEPKVSKAVSPAKKTPESRHTYLRNKAVLQQNSKSQERIFSQNSNAKISESWATPALDEFCDEYFRSVKEPKPGLQKLVGGSLCSSRVVHPDNFKTDFGGHCQESSSSSAVQDNDPHHHPPAMLYFFHDDPRIQKLVRERLQHFVPIGAASTGGNEQSRPENPDQMGHFGPVGASNGPWVTPNRRVSIPTDVGKRRVHASGSQSGHWFTAEDGRKVYISKNGQELTGQIAYRQYRKESGAGFRKSKKGGSTKKEGSTRAKRGSTKNEGSTRTKQGSTRAKNCKSRAKQRTTRAKKKR